MGAYFVYYKLVDRISSTLQFFLSASKLIYNVSYEKLNIVPKGLHLCTMMLKAISVYTLMGAFMKMLDELFPLVTTASDLFNTISVK